MKQFFKQKKCNKQKIFNSILLLFSIGFLIYFCVVDDNLFVLLSSISTLQPVWLIAACLSMLLFWMIDANLLYLITSLVYPGRYQRKSAFKVTMVGQYFNAISPFAVAGQPMQIVTMLRQGISAGVAFSILVQKFLIYQTTLTAYSLLVILFKYSFFQSQFPGFMLLALIGFAVQSFVVVMLLLFSLNRKFTTKMIHLIFSLLARLHIIKHPEQTSEKVKVQLEFYLDNNKAMSQNYRMTIKLYSLTFLQLTAMYIIPFLIYKAFHNTGFPVIDMICAQSFVSMIASYTPLPGASGTSEGSFLVIFDLFFSNGATKQAMLLWRFITYYSCIIVGSVFAGFESKKEKLQIDMSTVMQQSMKEVPVQK